MLSQNFDLLGSITNLLVSYFVSNATFVLQVWVAVAVSGAADRAVGFLAMRGPVIQSLQATFDPKHHRQYQRARQFHRFGD